MIGRLLPSCCVAVEAFEDVAGEPPVRGEADLIERAVESRRREFVTARRCARSALARLGLPEPGPIRSGPGREPIWPPGVVGSITHCPGYRAAVVARRGRVTSLGIDAEPSLPLPDGVAEVVMTASERAHLSVLDGQIPDIHWDRLLFSAKEAVFKAWFPLTHRWVDFREVEVRFEPQRSGFTATVRVGCPSGGRRDSPLDWCGGYAAVTGLVMTAVADPGRRR